MRVGDYVRTKQNGIIKIDEIIDNGIITHEDDFGREWEEETNLKIIRYNDKDGWNKGINENDVLKSSPNIIDLIEVGDLMFLNIANKKEAFKDLVVPRIAETENELQRYLEKLNNGEFALKGILTKEQIENGVYWVNE